FVSINETFGQNLEKQFNEVLSGQNFENSPGFAILVAKNNQVIYRKAFGYANLELDVKLQPEHIFRIGSITKQFTACAILKLEEEGKLSLQDDIKKYIKDYPTHGHIITIEQLLTHTSGIKSYTSMEEWNSELHKKNYTPVELIEFFKKEPMDFAPGEKFLYNNSAYFLLGYIIEIASGKTYEQYLHDSFFEPLKLINTSYDNTVRIVKNRIPGYQKKDDIYQNAPFLSMTQPYSAGSLMSNVDDLFKWYSAVMNDKVITKENRIKAHTSFKLNNGKPTGYGYGWALGNIQGSPMIQHGGGIHGFLTASIYLPDEKVFVAVFSNSDSNPPQNTALKMAAIAIEKPFKWDELKLDKKALAEYEGVFESENDGNRTLVLENDSLMYVLESGMKQRLIPCGTDKFYITDRLSTYIFNRNDAGKIKSLSAITTSFQSPEWIKTDKPIELKKDIQLTEEQLKKYAGKYELMPEFILTISTEGTKVFIQATGQGKSEIFATELHKFYSKIVNAQIEFQTDENGNITGLILFQNGEHKAKKIE
ncbi:MAG: serine hydrolase, partial [Bacteroidetes bacterium]